MAFVYVVGVAGSGKSAIATALSQRGYAIFDEDVPGVGAAHNKQSGRLVQVPSVGQRTPEWFDAHEWRVLDETLAELVLRSATDDIVLCGNSLSDTALREVDAKVIYLHIDEATLCRRIEDRTDNDYGKSERELAEIKERHLVLDERFLATAVVIDATRSLELVLNEVAGLLELP